MENISSTHRFTIITCFRSCSTLSEQCSFHRPRPKAPRTKLFQCLFHFIVFLSFGSDFLDISVRRVATVWREQRKTRKEAEIWMMEQVYSIFCECDWSANFSKNLVGRQALFFNILSWYSLLYWAEWFSFPLSSSQTLNVLLVNQYNEYFNYFRHTINCISAHRHI